MMNNSALVLSAAALLFAVLPAAGCAGHAGPAAQPARDVDLTAVEAPTGGIWLETLDLSVMEQEWGEPHVAESVDGKPLTINGQVYPRGIGTHAYSELVIDLKKAARSFHAVVGVDDESESRGSIEFVVVVDGHEVHRTPVLRGDDPPETLAIDLSGARELMLIVEDGQDDINHDHADWAGALLIMKPGATAQPQTVPLPPATSPRIAMGTALEPVIHAPRITGATPGRAFLFRIPATGEPPLRFAAERLPAGLTLDPATGLITGALESPGMTDVKLTVTGPRGKATSTLTIVGGEHSLALTPPMGWNSWNVWGTAVDDAKVRSAADAMVASGLAAHGYQYINIDDAWEGERGPDGRIQTNPKFPDMKALADYVHSKGLKLGIYSSPGPKTCAGYEGSYEHELLDAQTYAEWGIDLLKYDWCSYGKIAEDHSRPELRKPYDVMRAALDQCGRDIVYSLCQYGMGDVSEWGAAVGGNYWRTTGDIVDSWSNMSRIGFGQNGLEQFAGPGHWNDPDMLVVGKVGWSENLHPTRLTPNEQVTHITLWSLLAAPLLIGCDMADMDEFTLALLTNPEVLEVNQDPLGKQAARVAKQGRLEVWARPLADGSIAVGLFNRSRAEAPITAKWQDLGLGGPQRVRNLWLRKDLGVHKTEFTATVPRHGAMMLKVSAAR